MQTWGAGLAESRDHGSSLGGLVESVRELWADSYHVTGHVTDHMTRSSQIEAAEMELADELP